MESRTQKPYQYLGDLLNKFPYTLTGTNGISNTYFLYQFINLLCSINSARNPSIAVERNNKRNKRQYVYRTPIWKYTSPTCRAWISLYSDGSAKTGASQWDIDFFLWIAIKAYTLGWVTSFWVGSSVTSNRSRLSSIFSSSILMSSSMLSAPSLSQSDKGCIQDLGHLHKWVSCCTCCMIRGGIQPTDVSNHTFRSILLGDDNGIGASRIFKKHFNLCHYKCLAKTQVYRSEY